MLDYYQKENKSNMGNKEERRDQILTPEEKTGEKPLATAQNGKWVCNIVSGWFATLQRPDKNK